MLIVFIVLIPSSGRVSNHRTAIIGFLTALVILPIPVLGQIAPQHASKGSSNDSQSPAALATAAAFCPGELWPDNQGVPINCHGGGVLYHKGTYWWFGQHMIEGTAGNQAMVGVHAYSSTNLYHWQDRGIALRVSDDPQSEITQGCILERPKVIFNRKTQQVRDVVPPGTEGARLLRRACRRSHE